MVHEDICAKTHIYICGKEVVAQKLYACAEETCFVSMLLAKTGCKHESIYNYLHSINP